MKKQQGDFDKALEHQAAEGDSFTCFFCDKQTTNSEEMACAPEGSSQEIADLYLQRPRCVKCEQEMHGNRAKNMAKELFGMFYTPSHSDDEYAALDEIFAQQDREALSASDIDKLAEEKGDGRFWP